MKKVAYLDSLRGLAVLGVILVHCGLFSELSPWLKNVTTQGARGVQLFFMLSALTLFLSMDSRTKIGDSKTNFFIRRFFRIAPLFYLAFIIYTIEKIGLDKMGLKQMGHITLGNIIGTITFIPNGFYHSWINNLVPGGWSITVEMTFYLFVPWLFTKIKKLSSAIYLTLGTGIIGFGLTYIMSNFIHDQEYLFYWFPNQIVIFSLGLVAYFLTQINLKLSDTKKTWFSNAVVAISIILMFMISQVSIPIIPIHFIYGILFLGLIFSLHLKENVILVNKVTVFLGKISFSIYLTQFLILDIVRYILSKFIFKHISGYVDFIVLFILTSVVTIGVSFITYKIIEIPGMNLGKKIIKIRSNKETIYVDRVS